MLTRKLLLLSSLSLSMSVLSAAQTHNNAALIRYWDTYVQNNSEYALVNPQHSLDEKGWLLSVNHDTLPAQENTLALQFEDNYLGQLSQDITYQVSKQGEIIGECVLHAGLGSFAAYPDFTGTTCQVTEDPTLTLHPTYAIDNNELYRVTYTLDHVNSFSRLYVFGDSLSDTGNAYKADGGLIPQSPPYYKGHFSNGPIWVEDVAAKLNLNADSVFDYAYGGAKSHGGLIPTLSLQITEYATLHPTADPFALYAVWIGSNDFLDDVDNAEEATSAAVDSIADGITRLAEQGAKTFLVPNLPNLGLTPKAMLQDQDNGNHDFSNRLNELASLFNNKLATELDTLATTLHVSIIPFDTYQTLDTVITKADEYGIDNITQGCNPNWYTGGNEPICNTPDTYLFWDDVHPSQVTHEYLSSFIHDTLVEHGYADNNSNTSLPITAQARTARTFNAAQLAVLKQRTFF